MGGRECESILSCAVLNFQHLVVEIRASLHVLGMTIPDCQKTLPGALPGGEPLLEAILWLLLTGK
ncbi:citrate synthase, partial [Trifolium medium]|nr:citrate synthase [Trifolium medium]